MYSYSDVERKIDREIRRKRRKTEKNSRMQGSPRMLIRQADVLIVNFGDSDRGIHGKHPACVISSDESLSKDNVLMVVPLFRNPSKDNDGGDVRIREIDCRGIRYEEYASIANVGKVYRRQVIKKIGHIKNDAIIKELTISFLEKVGEN